MMKQSRFCEGLCAFAACGLALAAAATTQTVDDSDGQAWDGSSVIQGVVTKANALLVAADASAPQGLAIAVTGAVENAVNLKTSGSKSAVVTMGGPLAISAHEGCDTAHVLFGNGDVTAAGEPFAVNLDWGAKPIDVRLATSSVSALEGLRGVGLRVTGPGGTSAGHRAIATINGGIDAGGGDILADGAVLEFSDWIKDGKAAYTGRGIQNATKPAFFRNRGGVLFSYQPVPSNFDVRLEHGGIFGFAEGSWQTDVAATTTMKVEGSGYFFCNYKNASKRVTVGGLELAPGAVLFVPGKVGSTVSQGFAAPSAGVQVVGGDGSVSTQVPVAVGLVRMLFSDVKDFSSRVGHVFGLCTYDASADAFVSYDGTGTFSSDWENATELDNMTYSDAMTLARDTKVNAIQSTSGKDLDLGGNALEVVSGMFIATYNSSVGVKNGTVRIGANPLVVVDNAGGSTIAANIETTNADSSALVYSFHGGGGDYKDCAIKFTGDNTGATGRFYFGRRFAKALTVTFRGDSALGPGMVIDSSVGATFNLQGGEATGHETNRVLRAKGLAGCGLFSSYSISANSDADAFFRVPMLVLGDDSANPVTRPSDNARKVVVASGGFVEPGERTTDGVRVGALTIAADKHGFLRKLEFASGGELRVRAEAGGVCTRLDVRNLSEGVTLGGALVVSAAADAKSDCVVLTSTTPITGAFESVTPGWKASVVARDDGTYAVVASPKSSGFILLIQ